MKFIWDLASNRGDFYLELQMESFYASEYRVDVTSQREMSGLEVDLANMADMGKYIKQFEAFFAGLEEIGLLEERQ
ncbi:hypothetical protein KBC77_03875 [Candidatus Saccharibacteria bacterium]|nr:hypothetical protein [Candidatus Saccharibacteria bacterium]